MFLRRWFCQNKLLKNLKNLYSVSLFVLDSDSFAILLSLSSLNSVYGWRENKEDKNDNKLKKWGAKLRTNIFVQLSLLLWGFEI